MILIPLLPGDQVKITSLRAGGMMTLVVPFAQWKYPDEPIIEKGTDGFAKWAAETRVSGEFVIDNVPSGQYVLLWMIAGKLYPLGVDGRFIRVTVQEGQTNDLGYLTLMNPSDPVTK